MNFDEIKKILPENYVKRLEHELDVIVNNEIKDFMPYFITLADIVKEAKKNGIMVGPGRGCLLPDVPIYTQEHGFINIKDVKINDTVITHTGSLKKVKNTFEYDYDDNVCEINIFGNNTKTLRVTPDHKIYTKKNNVVQWKKAEDVSSDDFVFIPKMPINNNTTKELDLKTILFDKNKNKYKYNNEHLYYYKKNLKKSKFACSNIIAVSKLEKKFIYHFVYEPETVSLKILYVLYKIAKNSKLSGLHELRQKMQEHSFKQVCLNRKIPINKEFSYLLGFINGCMSIANKSRVDFGIYWQKKEDLFEKLFKDVFNVDLSISYLKNGNYSYIVSCCAILDLFEYLFDKNHKIKTKLTHLVSEFNEDNLKNFLAGFMYGSKYGTKLNNKISVYSQKCAHDLRILLWKLQIPHEIKEIKKTRYRIFELTLFFTENENYEKTTDGMWVRVLNVAKFKEKSKIYDLEVEDDHSFLTSSGIVHNSAGGSLVAYLLGITEIDPIQYDIPFSRFLSKSRLKKSVPDIDVDFEVNSNNPKLHRDFINEYIFNKYGEKAAQIATFGMLKLKNSLQDSFRIHVVQPTENKIQKLYKETKKNEAEVLENWLKTERFEFDSVRKNFGKMPAGISDLEWLVGYNQDEIFYPGLLETNNIFAKWAEKYPQVIETAKLLLGIPRNIGKHAAGIVIADRSIFELCGVMKIDGKNVISYNKKDVSKLGLIKNDNLGLTCLNFIGDTLRQLKKKGIELDPWNLPESKEVFESFLDGKCLTIFQHETTGGANFVKKLNPKTKEDLFVSVALNRPGALDAKIKISTGEELCAADVFVKRKNKEIPVEYIHSDLESILKNSYGVYVFQEQVMLSLQLLLGYTEEESDAIRSAISDKNIQVFEEVKNRLYLLKQRNWSDEQINTFFQQIVAFSGYAFNKAHACAYGLLAYTTAYLKFYYPLEWWAAVLSNSNPDEVIEKYWQEINFFVEQPNINLSKKYYIIDNNKLIPPLNLIKNIGEKALDEISSKAPFSNFDDFYLRINKRTVNKKVILNLLESGSLNCLFSNQIKLHEKKRIFFELKMNYEKKKKIDATEEELKELNDYEEYLLAKEVLPISTLLLSKAILNSSNINRPFVNVQYYTDDFKIININSLRGTLPLVSGNKLQFIVDNVQNYENLFIEVCCYGYVLEIRQFNYYSKTYNMNKIGIEISISFDNFIQKILLWPNKAETISKVAAYIREKQAFLFKLKIDKQKKILITGIEEISKKILD